MTREEHLQWCKDRALQYVQDRKLSEAVASMMSDLNKHPETAISNPFLTQLGMMEVMNGNTAGVRRWIEGFN